MIPFMVLLTSAEIFNISPVSNTSRPSMKDIASEAGTQMFDTISVSTESLLCFTVKVLTDELLPTFDTLP